MEDSEMGDFDHSDAPIDEAEIERLQQINRPRSLGIMLTVFVAVLIIMIGGLISYYYYNSQKQGSSHEQNIKDNWDEIVITTGSLTSDFDKVTDFNVLFANTKDSFQDTLTASNRSLKDISYNLQSISGYAFSGNIVISKMSAFVEAYVDYLRELQSIINNGRADLITDIKEVDNLDQLNTALSEAYNKLLIADKNKIITTELPADLFKLSDGMQEYIQKYLEDKKQKGEADDAEKISAQAVTNKFMQAYTSKDADSMMSYLTEQAKSEFNKGVVEDATEIKSFEITDTRKLSDIRIEIDASIKKETPDKGSVTEKRKFVMLKKDTIWLIDSWKIVS